MASRREDIELHITGENEATAALSEATEDTERLGQASEETAEHQRKLDEANKGLGGGLESIKNKLNAAAGALAAYFALDAAKEYLDEAAAIGKEADAVGLAVDTYSGLRTAFENAGVGANDFQEIVANITEKLFEARESGSNADKLFRSLGVSVRDSAGGFKDINQALFEVFDGFSQGEDTAKRFAQALGLTGEEGAKATAIFARGGDELKRLATEALNSGQALKEGQVRAAQEAQEQLNELLSATKTLAQQIVIDLAPAITEVVKLMNSGLGPALSFAGSMFRHALVGAVTLSQGLSAALSTLSAVADAVANLDFSNLDEKLDRIWAKAQRNIADTADRIYGLQPAFDSAGKSGEAALNKIAAAAKAAQVEVAEAFETLGLSAEKAGGQATEAGKKVAEAMDALIDKGDLSAEALTRAFQAAIPKAETVADIDALAERLEKLRLTGSLAEPQLKALNAALDFQRSTLEIKDLDEALGGIQGKFDKLAELIQADTAASQAGIEVRKRQVTAEKELAESKGQTYTAHQKALELQRLEVEQVNATLAAQERLIGVYKELQAAEEALFLTNQQLDRSGKPLSDNEKERLVTLAETIQKLEENRAANQAIIEVLEKELKLLGQRGPAAAESADQVNEANRQASDGYHETLAAAEEMYAAVRAGARVSVEEIQALIEQVEALGNTSAAAAAKVKLEEAKAIAERKAYVEAQGGLIDYVINSWVKRLNQLSEAATATFQQIGLGEKRAAVEGETLNAAILRLGAEMSQLTKHVANNDSAFIRWATRLAVIARNTELLFLQQRLAVESTTAEITALTEKADLSSSEIYRLTALAETAVNRFDLLGEEDLSTLKGALDAARQKLADIEQAALEARQALGEMAEDLQDEIDQLQGRQEDIENRRHLDRLEQIAEEARQAGDAGRQEAETARQRAEELHRLRLAQIRDQAQAEQQSQASAPPAPSTSPSGGAPAGSLGGPTTNNNVTVNMPAFDPSSLSARAINDLARRIRDEIEAIETRTH